MRKYLLTILAILIAAGFIYSQSPSSNKEELERERREIQNELKEIQEMYNKVKGQTKQSLGQLNMLARKVKLQERYIYSINRELRMIDDDLYRSNLEIYRLQRQLDTLKSEYARTIVYAYKNRSSFDYVNFIFSATSFNDAVRRVAYLKSYRAYREKQVTTINETQQLIAKRQQQQIGRKQQKSVALQSQTKEKNELAEQKKEKDQVVSKLKSQSNDLKREIAVKKKRDRDLNNAIQAIVRREIDAAKKKEASRLAAEKKERDRIAAEKKKNETAADNPVTTPVVTPTKPEAVEKKPLSYLEVNERDVALGADFSNNKGKLPWPVDKSVVLIPFGRYKVDGFDNIVDDNPGLTIGTPIGSSVKAVFTGEVIGVHNYGDAAAVIVRHGKYITAYSNLSAVSVTKGAIVRTGHVVGRAGEADDGSGGQINFVLMIENKNVNPAHWLRR
ncbi:MAG TPA: peptidoglycan DD-metalloendopeptidase family protein [Chitinophagaceae bacterium]|nr:peptidoglycan DD-metalloendopeptidase family protein [Chitinophagaceae bacterium]